VECLLHGNASEIALRDTATRISADLGLDPSTVEIRRADTVGQLTGDLAHTEKAFVWIAAVILVVSTLGLINIGLATVRERTRDLTIRRAFGATRSRVFCLVLTGALLLGLLSAITAIGVAYLGVSMVVPHLLDPHAAIADPQFPWGTGVQGVLVAIFASLAGGLAPAAVAARVDPAYILRA
jgi:putative ABC transport system permease protein